MEFFNAKEEVIDIQLTQHGKRILAKGLFKPVYYAFYDDDIIYDVRYASATSSNSQRGLQLEEQSEATERIFETPRLKVFHKTPLNQSTYDVGDYGGLDYQEEVWKLKPFFGGEPELGGEGPPGSEPETGEQEEICFDPIKGVPIQCDEEDAFRMPASVTQRFERVVVRDFETRTLSLSALGLLGLQGSTRLGNSSLHSDFAPAWDVKLLTNEISGAVTYFPNQAESFQIGINEQIPQIDIEVKSFLNIDTFEFERIDDLVFSALETNGVFEKENLDIEVYMVDESGCIKKDLTDDEITDLKAGYVLKNPAASASEQDAFIDSLAYEGHSCPEYKQLFFADPSVLGETSFNLGANYVEYWFNIFVDDQIDTSFVKLKPTQVYSPDNIEPEKEC